MGIFTLGLMTALALPSPDDPLAADAGTQAVEWLKLHRATRGRRNPATFQLVEIHNGGVDAQGVAKLRALPNLKHLDFSDCPYVQDDAAPFLGQMTGLRTLALEKTGITDATLPYLRTLTNLERLDVAETAVTKLGATVFLYQMPAALRVDIIPSRKPPPTSEQLRKFLADHDLFVAEPAMETMVSLDLSEGYLHPDIPAHYLPALPALREIDMEETRNVDDITVFHLTRLPQLTALDLEATEITDASIPFLAGMPNLQAVDLRRTGVTEAGIASLRDARPECDITYRTTAYLIAPLLTTMGSHSALVWLVPLLFGLYGIAIWAGSTPRAPGKKPKIQERIYEKVLQPVDLNLAPMLPVGAAVFVVYCGFQIIFVGDIFYLIFAAIHFASLLFLVGLFFLFLSSLSGRLPGDDVRSHAASSVELFATLAMITVFPGFLAIGPLSNFFPDMDLLTGAFLCPPGFDALHSRLSEATPTLDHYEAFGHLDAGLWCEGELGRRGVSAGYLFLLRYAALYAGLVVMSLPAFVVGVMNRGEHRITIFVRCLVGPGLALITLWSAATSGAPAWLARMTAGWFY